MKKDNCIKTPEDIDWVYFWSEKLKQKIDRNKDWDKAAPNFGKSAKRDDYHIRFIQELDLSKEDSVLDLGCGVGRNSIPIAEKLKHRNGKVVCVDILDSALNNLIKYSKKHLISQFICVIFIQLFFTLGRVTKRGGYTPI